MFYSKCYYVLPNAVGYKNYPDNVIQKFVKESAEVRCRCFRIFDSLNWIDQMKVANEAGTTSW